MSTGKIRGLTHTKIESKSKQQKLRRKEKRKRAKQKITTAVCGPTEQVAVSEGQLSVNELCTTKFGRSVLIHTDKLAYGVVEWFISLVLGMQGRWFES